MQEFWCSQNQPTSGIKTQTLTHFFPMFPFDAPENIRKPFDAPDAPEPFGF